MIKQEYLTPIFGAAPCVINYGGPGMRKTNFIATLPAPILMFDLERGMYSITPWVRRWRNWSKSEWNVVTQEQRKQSLELLNPAVKQQLQADGYPVPQPLIDVIRYDNLNPESFTKLAYDVLNLNIAEYNSIALDSLQDLSFQSQNWAKTDGRNDPVKVVTTAMHVKYWSLAQDRMILACRKLKDFTVDGVVVYATAGEQIDKDYVIDPRETPQGQKPQDPYSINGTMNLPGKIPNLVAHISDIIVRSSQSNGRVVCTSKPEAISAGSASWISKDRYGRLNWNNPPDMRVFFTQLVGAEMQKKIYNQHLETQNNG